MYPLVPIELPLVPTPNSDLPAPFLPEFTEFTEELQDFVGNL